MSYPVVILAGGLGTRLESETILRPKPMVGIGGVPILTHIMARYSLFGFNEFIICGGYKIDVIHNYFNSLPSQVFNTQYSYPNNEVVRKELPSQDYDKEIFRNLDSWKVSVLNTGSETTTAGRILKTRELIKGRKFLCTYGDGLSDINLDALVEFHESKGLLATVTAVNPPSRFGDLSFDASGKVSSFSEKQLSSAFINGGFFVFENTILDLLNPLKSLEDGLLTELTNLSQLIAYQHRGFWQNMDTPREMKILNDIYAAGWAPWLLKK